MKKKFLGIIFASLTFGAFHSSAQNNSQLPTAHYNEEGRFMEQYRNLNIEYSKISSQLNVLFNLNDDNTFILNKKSISKLTGIEHYRFNQFFKGFLVQNAEVLIRVENWKVTSINGRILPQMNKQIDMKVNYNESDIRNIIVTHQNILKVNYSQPAELVILHNNNLDAQLVFKMRVDGVSTAFKYSYNEYYVNAQTGQIIKIKPINSHIDVEGTAHTLYNGEQTITSDLVDGVYYLKDNDRNIVTYNASGQTPDLSPEATVLFPSAQQYTNSTENWLPNNNLMSITLSAAEYPSLVADIGLSFTTFRGNRLITTVEQLVDGSYVEVGRNEELGVSSTVSLPYTISNLNVILQDGEEYRVVIYKDSCMIDFSSFELVSVLAYEDSKVEFDIEESGVGTHDWTDVGNNGQYVIEFVENPALDAHWGITVAHDYYKELFERISFDGEGTLVTNYYNGTAMVSGTQNNAGAMNAPYNSMIFGTGQDGFKPFVVLDVTGHEYSHLVIGTTSNLEYTGESGALNESFADMMGIAIENYALGSLENWYMGDGLHDEIPFIRNLSNPNDVGMSETRQPDTYNGNYWAPTGDSDPDNGGVHINSGVGNYWFYLLCEGGEGVNDNGDAYNVTPIGIAKAEKIAYLAFTEYMTATTQYIDAYNLTKEAAIDLYGEGTPEYNAVVDAWHAVGIPVPSSNFNAPERQAEVSIYPNPSNGQFTVNIMDGYSYNLKIYNVLGQEVFIKNMISGLNNFHVENLMNGIYYVELKSDQGQSIQKMTIIK